MNFYLLNVIAANGVRNIEILLPYMSKFPLDESLTMDDKTKRYIFKCLSVYIPGVNYDSFCLFHAEKVPYEIYISNRVDIISEDRYDILENKFFDKALLNSLDKEDLICYY